MESNFSSGVAQPSYQNSISHHSPSKALGTHGPATKSIGEAGGPAANSELALWFEEANAYYNAVMAGDPNTPPPPQEEWNGFLSQLQWAQTQPYGAQGAPGTMGMPGMGQAQGPQSNQFGGTSGTMDNWIYTNEKTEIGFTGNGTHDIWGNDIIINVAPTSADVVIENTTDTRFAPSESVVKITVTDPATGTQSVYFVHDYDPAKDKIQIKTPDSATQVSNLTGDVTSITTGKFTPGTAASSKPDASIDGVPQADGTILYEPEFAGGTIDFWANPGESQTHVIFSDANISVKPSDEVKVGKPDPATGIITVLVTHSDGTTDTYQIQKGYKVNVNANAEYIQFDGKAGSDGVPTDMGDRVTLNGGVGTEPAAGAVDADGVVTTLLGLTEPVRSEAQLMSALNSIYPGKYADIAAFKKAIADGTFPGAPDNKLLDFLRLLDGDLDTKLKDALAMVGSNDTDDKKKSATKAVQDRLVELLSALMPNDIVSSGSNNKFEGTISVNGTNYNWTTWGSNDWVFK